MLKQEMLCTFYEVNVFRKIRHIKPSIEKIFHYLYKTDKRVHNDLLLINIEYLHKKCYLKVDGEDEELRPAADASANRTHEETTKLEKFLDSAEKNDRHNSKSLESNNNSNLSYERIIKSGKNSIGEHCAVNISSIVSRNDEWNNKVQEPSSCLKTMCKNI